MTQRPDVDLDARHTSTNGVTRVWFESDGQTIGSATVSRDGACVTIGFAIAQGRAAGAGRRRLLQAAFGLPEVRPHQPVKVAIPLGDVDLLNGVQSRVAEPTVRAAGSTCLIEALIR